ncbi:MAG TPA: preprotein translocase subunit SecA, partial [Desulfotomaculum sp.]|nr:preprotein translocase subunit SecA [Desulfotomaculum sp.]
LSVGLIVHGLNEQERRAAYADDVIYGTNNEFGFDYLRYNMALHPSSMVQRELHYAIVDEVDSILIDEARTPLIISGQAEKSTNLYHTFSRLVPRLVPEQDYSIDEKARTVNLTEAGVAKMEKMLKIDNLYADEHTELTHHLQQALKAHVLMKKDRDYVVKDGQVIIVDEFTGRLMFGRRYSEGLHQAIEAKEGVKVEHESQTLATITFQNYFRMYEKLAGMTGTAATEEEELRKIYKLDVVVIPTHKPMIRKDLTDVVYKTQAAKFRAVVEEIARRYETGQPVLVGTSSIEKSELLSQMLKRHGVPHQVLNAKYHEKEAEIVAQAGRLSTVTIATNMAGRGTDILLGGNPEFLAQAELKKQGNDLPLEALKKEPLYREVLTRFEHQTDEEHKKVVALGGLHILGTERHESRRIDNQLRGRSGRQGDPGSSQFFSALEDDLIRQFGGDNIQGLMNRLGIEEDMPIEHGLITRSIETAQKRVENRNFELRKHILQYDDVMNQQRELIYRQRRQVLQGENLKDVIAQMIEETACRLVDACCPEGVHPEEWDLTGLLSQFEQLFVTGRPLTGKRDAFLAEMENTPFSRRQEIKDKLRDYVLAKYEERETELGAEILREIERVVLLRVVDEKWMEHLDAMDDLREGIGLRAYGQKDPLVEYKRESYEMFQKMIAAIQEEVARYVFRVKVVQEPQVQPQQLVENRYAEEEVQRPARREVKVGRNALCPCGSGKKYKKCCGRAAG